MSNLKIVIAHAWWDERRRESCQALVRQTKADEVFISKEPEPSHVWARRIWEWVATLSPRDEVLILNDDVDVHPELRTIIGAMREGAPQAWPLALHTTFPEAEHVKPWCRSYWMTGPAYILNEGLARCLLEFWDGHSELHDANEDVVGIYYAWERKVPWWHPVPAPVIHRVDLPSAIGHDKHPHRVTNVPWTHCPWPADLTDPDYWRVGPPRFEIPWMTDKQLTSLRSGRFKGTKG